MPDRNFQRAGTPSVHAAGWDPTSSGRTWSSTYMTIDGRSSRVAPSRQRARDGQVFRDRAETLLMGADHSVFPDELRNEVGVTQVSNII